MTIVYISGPMSGLPGYNYEAFNNKAAHLRKTGHQVVNPVEVCAHLPAGSDWQDYMDICLPAMYKCKKIYLLRGWEKSRGAKRELLDALIKGMEVETE